MASIVLNGKRYTGGSGGSGGGNTNSVELTMAEYKALGDVVLTDGVTYYITDADDGSSMSAKMRYIDDPNSENFDWIQVNYNGEWVNSHRAYVSRYWFIEDGLNKGNLSIVSGGSMTYDDTGLTILSGSNRNASAPGVAQYSFDAVDLTNYDKIIVKQTTTFPGTDTSVSNNSITVSVKDTSGNTLTSAYAGIVNGSTTNSNDIVLDVSNINEVGIICIEVRYYTWTSDNLTYSFNCKLSQVYAE